jgi:DNA-binding transcriptional LysR family regulator
MTLFQLEVLVAVADNGSFTRAGEKIGLTQSGVSHTIGALERELGVLLFSRSRNVISLTSAGEEAVQRARIILVQAEQITHLKKAPSYRGVVRIGSFSSATKQLVPPLVRTMRKLYPQLELQVLEGAYPEIETWIHCGIVDIGFLSLPAEDLEVIPLQQDPLQAILPTGHVLANESSITLAQLAGEPFILPTAGCERLIENACRQAKVDLDIRYEAADNAAVLAMVEAGVGVSVVPALTLPEDLSKVAVRPVAPALYRQIGLALKSADDAPPHVHALIREAKRLLQDPPAARE